MRKFFKIKAIFFDDFNSKEQAEEIRDFLLNKDNQNKKFYYYQENEDIYIFSQIKLNKVISDITKFYDTDTASQDDGDYYIYPYKVLKNLGLIRRNHES